MKRPGNTFPISISLREGDIEKANYLIALLQDEEIQSMSALVRWLITRELKRRGVDIT